MERRSTHRSTVMQSRTSHHIRGKRANARAA
jgi:hypothetical protein